MPKKKLTDDDAQALVLSGLKGEVPVLDLCRKYGVSNATYYKLRDQFIAGGVQGLQNNGKTNQVKALELKDLGVPRSWFYPRIVRVTKHLNLSRTIYLIKNYPQQSK
jgi:transposase-like protein